MIAGDEQGTEGVMTGVHGAAGEGMGAVDEREHLIGARLAAWRRVAGSGAVERRPGGHAVELRWAQPVVRLSITANSSYMIIAMAPMTTSPANARPICIDEPAEISR